MRIINPCSVLSFDIGQKRIGLAGCDPLGITVTPLQPIKRTDFKCDMSIIQKHCQERNVQGIIVGLPLDDNCKATNQTKHCLRYGKKVANELNLPIAWINEHSSTWAASKIYGLYKDKSGHLDSIAATILLNQWLRDGPELEPVKTADLHTN